MNPIPINLVVEDELSETVARRLLADSRHTYAVNTIYNQGGFGYIKKRVRGFNRAAAGIPFLVLTDLDANECAPGLIEDWLHGDTVRENLLFRVAVREIESWLLADKRGFARFIGVREGVIPTRVEEVTAPKEKLIEIVRTSTRNRIREDIVPPSGSTRVQGPDYNSRLSIFASQHWNPTAGAEVSPSLKRTIEHIDAFNDCWHPKFP